jgi:hemerythrin
LKISNLLEACNARKGNEEVLNTIEYLGDYVIFHFSEEEKLQRDNNYPEYKNHKAAHEKFIKDYENLKVRMEEEGISVNFIITVNKVVVDWLIKHIGSADKALGAYLKSKQ